MTKIKKILSIVVAIAVMFSFTSMDAFAATSVVTQLEPYDNALSALSINGSALSSVERVVENLKNSKNKRITYYIEFTPGTTSNAEVDINFTPNGKTLVSAAPPVQNPGFTYHYASKDYHVQLKEGVASRDVYVHHDFPDSFGKCDTYIFKFSIANPISISTGDTVYIKWGTTDPTQGIVTGRDGSTTIPANFTLWADGISTITIDGVSKNADYSNTGGGHNNYAFEINTKPTTMIIEAGQYTISCPPKTEIPDTPAGSSPSRVVSYLPIGQFATGSGWGSSNNKFANKTTLESTGVSLGALGGYIEFEFEDGIQDISTNPYGVDFVVYGNAFNGNPEAGAVQVSEDGTTWYELAGSEYYNNHFAFYDKNVTDKKYSNVYSGTLRNTEVEYELLSSEIKAKLGNYKQKVFTTATAWWPDISKYSVENVNAAHTDNNVTISRTNSKLKFGGVTAIEDSDITADYAFGYADVTPNGNPNQLGLPVNPYTPYTSSKTGGDGFDLAWAVDISTGKPVNVSGKSFKYVRVYTAVLDNGFFGETSAEVCGIFTTVGNDGSPATKDLVLKKTHAIATTNGGYKTIDPGVYTVKSSKEHVFVNGQAITASGNGYSLNVESGKTYQIITQNLKESPYITVIKGQ